MVQYLGVTSGKQPYIKLSELDFYQIKNNLRDFVSMQTLLQMDHSSILRKKKIQFSLMQNLLRIFPHHIVVRLQQLQLTDLGLSLQMV